MTTLGVSPYFPYKFPEIVYLLSPLEHAERVEVCTTVFNLVGSESLNSGYQPCTLHLDLTLQCNSLTEVRKEKHFSIHLQFCFQKVTEEKKIT